MALKEYLVDVPVRVNIWIRPECQKRQWEVIREARPSILFLQSDGGRNDKEWDAIYQNRNWIEERLDWDCTVYKFYEDHNNGLYAMGKKVADFIWSTVDRCIFLEDDQIPSVSFFRYCAELLEKYKDDTRIQGICGMNHLGISEEVSADYFFATQGSIWGTATWKRVRNLRELGFDFYNDPYTMKLLKEQTKHNKIVWKRICGFAENGVFEGHVPGSEFWKEFNIYGQGMVQIIPKKNMINNIGFEESAEHFNGMNTLPRALRRLFNMQTYELEFPLKHPDFVIPDKEYERKRDKILAYNHPIRQWYRNLETVFYRVRRKGLRSVVRHHFAKK